MSGVPFAFGARQSDVSFDAYADLDFANTYHAARQSAKQWDYFSDDEKCQRLTSASDWIDRIFPNGYIGQPETATQHRAFPRLLPPSGEAVTPFVIKQACCELALINDVSGSLNNAAKLKNTGGVLIKSGECGGDDKELHMNLQAVLLLLEPYRRPMRSVRLERG